ncbi:MULTISPECIES: glutathione S-transferase family protein [unclassified Francisella]|uniref:glutathione S-transferase family protein n=1 Tax=unclassified Francisella TaxID=2610885 RepID=UPI002E360777|nr:MULTISPECIES: glutathione S-transferase family protein [unclassified Francisella]MED7820065.1 glutathione S-transferase family protein [Francisella sp. 19S2-4]MED7830875.1 glutathione S-transferase family protein [Francisella sp. 19S2-10]
MIHLNQLPPLKGKNYSSSPFCLKLELYLKVMDIDYKNHFNLEFNKSPTGKMPYIETMGKKFADSNLIIKMLEQQNQVSIDSHLDPQQKTISTAFIRLCEDSLYWVGVYGRWADKNNTAWKKDFTESINLPKAMANIIYPVAKRNVLRQLKAIGVVNLTNDEIYSKAEENLKAITDFLGDREYFFNNKVSLVDLVVFSFVIMMRDGSCGKRLQSFLENTQLDNFINNIQQEFDI